VFASIPEIKGKHEDLGYAFGTSVIFFIHGLQRKQKAIRQKGTIEFNPNQMVIKEIIELWKIQLVDLPSSCTSLLFGEMSSSIT